MLISGRAYPRHSVVERVQDSYQPAMVANAIALLWSNILDPFIIEPDNDVLNSVKLTCNSKSEATTLVVIPNSGSTKKLAQMVHLSTPLAQPGIDDDFDDSCTSRECTPDLIPDSGLSEASASPPQSLRYIESEEDEPSTIPRQLPDAVLEAISGRLYHQWQALHLHQHLGQYLLDSSAACGEFEVERSQKIQLSELSWTSKTSRDQTCSKIVVSQATVNALAKDRNHGDANSQSSGPSHYTSLSTEQPVDSLSSSRAVVPRPSSRKRINQDDDQNKRKRPKTLDREPSYTKPNILRCPYTAYDAGRYSPRNTTEKNYRTCAGSYLTSIAKLK